MARTPIPHNITDVFRGSQARKAGLVTLGQLRGHSFRRLFQDVYAPAELPVTHELRCRGAALIVPKEAVLTGRSAATVRGVELAKPHDPVEFIVPEEFRFGPIRGIHVRRTEVQRNESRHWQGIRIARPARVALDLILRLSPRTHGWVRRLRIAVPDLDQYLKSQLVTVRRLQKFMHKRRNRGIILAREAVALSDARAESRPESELRVVLIYGGYSPSPQHQLHHKGKFLGRLDLCLEGVKVAIEYDGRWHLRPEQVARDQARRSRMEAIGWQFVIVDAQQLATDYAGILRRVRAASRRSCS
ncbi:MAG: hypothetical protein ACRDRN_13695 [Sciscionella sp.]